VSRNVNRRRFLQASAAGAAALSLSNVPLVHAGGNDVLRIGLIGCGGRGTGAAAQALKADPNVRLVAMGDAFRDRLDNSLANLERDNAIAQKIDVPGQRRFTGFDAYQHVIGAGVDVVLLCTPPHFRPIHLEAAVRARKHVFAEKPMAVDGPGVRRVLAACQEAQRQRLSVVAGFCWRYHSGIRQVVQRVHDGAVGEIKALQTTYNAGTLWHRARTPSMSDMEWQMRNWLYFTWLSGDFNVEQHCHSLDKMAWVMRNTYPVRCWGTGGRQVRTGPEFGHIFDHMAVTYEFDNGVRCFSMCRQQAGCAQDVSDYVFGSQGTAVLSRSPDTQGFRILGPNAWQANRDDRRDDMYQREHNELFASIRRGQPINDGDWMARSSLMAIMGRMAAYTGRVIERQEALESRQDLSPRRYDMSADLRDLPPCEVAQPGITTIS
jgi:myo-inositol 2-dehydrogenase / D-chiro-inositol 1-dehydrogenase